MTFQKTQAIFTDFLSFLKRPDDIQLKTSLKERYRMIFTLLILELILNLTLISFLNYGIQKFITLKTDRLEYNETFISSIIWFVIIVPLVEEAAFRYILRYNRLFSKIIKRDKWNRIFPFAVYSLSIFFGLIHIFNYNNDTALFYMLSPLIIFSQLFGGFILSFIRVRLDFSYAYFYHTLWNFLFIVPIPYITLLFTNPYMDAGAGQSYNLEIKERLFFNKQDKQSIKIDSSAGKIYKIESRQYSFQHILDTVYGRHTYYTDDFLLDMKFRSRNGVSKEDFKKILEKEYDIE